MPAQHAGSSILTRSMAMVAQLESAEINLDLTAVTLAADNAMCDVASLIYEYTTVISDIVHACRCEYQQVEFYACSLHRFAQCTGVYYAVHSFFPTRHAGVVSLLSFLQTYSLK